MQIKSTKTTGNNMGKNNSTTGGNKPESTGQRDETED